jgi:hypothetical protein
MSQQLNRKKCMNDRQNYLPPPQGSGQHTHEVSDSDIVKLLTEFGTLAIFFVGLKHEAGSGPLIGPSPFLETGLQLLSPQTT